MRSVSEFHSAFTGAEEFLPWIPVPKSNDDISINPGNPAVSFVKNVWVSTCGLSPPHTTKSVIPELILSLGSTMYWEIHWDLISAADE
jgi:hypothetical protein